MGYDLLSTFLVLFWIIFGLFAPISMMFSSDDEMVRGGISGLILIGKFGAVPLLFYAGFVYLVESLASSGAAFLAVLLFFGFLKFLWKEASSE